MEDEGVGNQAPRRGGNVALRLPEPALPFRELPPGDPKVARVLPLAEAEGFPCLYQTLPSAASPGAVHSAPVARVPLPSARATSRLGSRCY